MLGPAASLPFGPMDGRLVKHPFSASGYYYAEAIEVALRRLSKHRRLRIFSNRLCCWRHTVDPLKNISQVSFAHAQRGDANRPKRTAGKQGNWYPTREPEPCTGPTTSYRRLQYVTHEGSS